jgi:hypothetical protein
MASQVEVFLSITKAEMGHLFTLLNAPSNESDLTFSNPAKKSGGVRFKRHCDGKQRTNKPKESKNENF